MLSEQKWQKNWKAEILIIYRLDVLMVGEVGLLI